MNPRARRRRLGGGVLLLGAAALGLSAARGGSAGAAPRVSAAPEVTQATATPCFLGLLCPTPTPTPSHTATPTPRPPTPTPTRSTAPPSAPSSSSSSSTVPPIVFDPGPTTYPTLAPETPPPGSPPAPPELSVESVLLSAAGGDTVVAGGAVLVEATCIAKRGADTYSVPHARVTFTLSAPAGSTASVNPATTDSGDTGIATVSVDAGEVPGDVVLAAASGSAGGALTIHVSLSGTPAPTASVSATPSSALPASTRTVDSGGTTGGRAVAVALLVAVGAAVLATTLARIALFPWVGRSRRRSTPENPVSSS